MDFKGEPRKNGMSPVQVTGDLLRIMALPVKSDVVIPDLSPLYRKPGGTMTLFPIQSEALYWASRIKGLIGLIGVGSGKTLISLLLSRAMGVSTTVLMIPPALRVQLFERDLPKLIQHWDIDVDGLHVVPYSMLSDAEFADVLEDIDPDLCVFDEAHLIRRLASARGKRLKRFRDGRVKRQKKLRLAYMSGTLTSEGLEDYAIACAWTLGRYSPLPVHYATIKEWAEALDPVDDAQRRPPGALRRLCKNGESVREGFSARLLSSPGVVATSELSVPNSMQMWPWSPKVGAGVYDAVKTVASDWQRPDGAFLADALSLFRVLRQVSVGFYYFEEWPGGVASDEYVDALREWEAVLRDTLRRKAKSGFDSPFLITLAALEGRWTCPEWERWVKVRDMEKPRKAARWLDLSVVRAAVQWGHEHTGLIWYMHEEVGRKIAELGGFPLIAAGMDKELAQLDGSQTAVLSLSAHGTGKDGLQVYADNLLTEVVSSNKRIEQWMGRTHRKGQKSDTVRFTYPSYLWLHDKAMTRALRQASYVKETTKQPQRLLLADWCVEEAGGTKHENKNESGWFDGLEEGQRSRLMDGSDD